MWVLLLSGNISEAVHTLKNFSVYILKTKQTVKKEQTAGVAFPCIAEPGGSWSFCFKLLLSVFRQAPWFPQGLLGPEIVQPSL